MTVQGPTVPRRALPLGASRTDTIGPYTLRRLIGRGGMGEVYLDGQPLSTLLLERRLPLDELADLAVPLAEALEYAHEQGVIHRDLKPA